MAWHETGRKMGLERFRLGGHQRDFEGSVEGEIEGERKLKCFYFVRICQDKEIDLWKNKYSPLD